MELALYCPDCGYYDKEKDIIGRRGDFYTSVSVGGLFGELLAFQFAEWLEDSEKSNRESRAGEGNQTIRIVEAGAHGGDLAKDILGWMREHRPGLFGRLEYWVVEPSGARRTWQQGRLAEFGDQVGWVRALSELADSALSGRRPPNPDGWRGLVFSNELLDAMPVHRIGWDAKARAWFEWGVASQAGRFVWIRLPGRALEQDHPQPGTVFGAPDSLLSLESELADILPDGFTTEVCPAAQHWWRAAAGALPRGKVMAIDYGLTAEEFLMPERKDGTLRGYYRHRSSSDVLACPGEQDLTAHVNFSVIRAAGESAGLRTDVFQTQAQFLTAIAASAWKEESSFGEWTPKRTRQFQTLTHPEHLGQSFRVLVQSRA